MKKRHLILTGALAALILSASIGGAWSYFTTYTSAKGGYTLSLGDETTISEDFSDWQKKVSVSNDADSQPVYVRVKAFAGSDYQSYLQYSGDGWNAGADGYYYYADPVAGGSATGELVVSLRDIPKTTSANEGDHFNVVIIYESTPVTYDASGSPVGASSVDWSQKVDTGTAGGAS